MTTKNPVSLDKWRDYFSSSNSDIFSIIEHAVMVAASDYPYDFKVKRDRIAEMLFTRNLPKCLRCDRTELPVAYDDCLKRMDGADEFKTGVRAGVSKDSKDSNVNSSSSDEDDEDDEDDDHIEVMEVNANNRVRDQKYDNVEALNDEIEEQSQLIKEVVRIKEVIDDFEGKSFELLIESLRRLQLMPLSMEMLESTAIGKSVNALRKHESKQIQNLCKSLVEGWRCIVNEWVKATEAIVDTDVATEPAKTSGFEDELEEEGLPSPPLDEVAFLSNPSTMELSQFFEGIDDDGNLQNCGEFNNCQQNGRMRIPERRTSIPKQKSPTDSRMPPKDSKDGNMRNQESTMKKEAPLCKQNAPSRPNPPSSETGARKPIPAVQPSNNNVVKVQQNGTIQKKPLPRQQEKLNRDNEASNQMNLETAKRKLHERYQEAENAKKQRTIQVVELRDLPKQTLARSKQQMRPGNHHSYRQRDQGRW